MLFIIKGVSLSHCIYFTSSNYITILKYTWQNTRLKFAAKFDHFHVISKDFSI